MRVIHQSWIEIILQMLGSKLGVGEITGNKEDIYALRILKNSKTTGIYGEMLIWFKIKLYSWQSRLTIALLYNGKGNEWNAYIRAVLVY